MFASKFKSVLLTSILALSAAAAQADVITFEGYAAAKSFKSYNGSGNVPLTGYALSSSGSNTATVFDSAYTQSVSNYASNDTDYLRLSTGFSVTFTSTVNKLFTVNSIDLANNYYTGNSVYNSTATLTGTFANGTTISTTYVLSNNNVVSTNDFTTELLSGYTNLTSFKIAASGYFLNVDNIVINQAATTAAVPEPASLAILGLGLFGIGALRRRKSA